MDARGELLRHAEAAVSRTARSLSDMRTRLQAPAAALGRQHRLLVEGALNDLGRRHEALTRLYETMIGASADQLPDCWQRFFACYDEYLEAVRDTRSRLIRDEREDAPGEPGGLSMPSSGNGSKH